MDWVEGETLFDWVRAALSGGRPRGAGRGGAAWLALVNELADAQIAHGDLQHANVMVTAGRRTETGRLRRHVRAGAGRAAEPGGGRRALPASAAAMAPRCCRQSLDNSRPW